MLLAVGFDDNNRRAAVVGHAVKSVFQLSASCRLHRMRPETTSVMDEINGDMGAPDSRPPVRKR